MKKSNKESEKEKMAKVEKARNENLSFFQRLTRMKSIRMKILVPIVAIALYIGGVTGFFAISQSQKAMHESINKNMTEMAIISSSKIQYAIETYKIKAEDIGNISVLSDDNVPKEVKDGVLKGLQSNYQLHGLFIASSDGSVTASTEDGIESMAGMEYFTRAMNGETVVTSPIGEGEDVHMLVVAPLWADGKAGGSVYGAVVVEALASELSDVTSEITIGETGSAFILDKTGTTIAHKDIDKVKNKENIIEISKKNNALSALADINKKMLLSETNFDEYEFGGVSKFISYAPIQGTDGWSIGVNAETDEFMEGMNTATTTALVIVLVNSVLAILAAILISTALAKPIIASVKRLQLLAKGDLTTPVPTTKSRDETGLLVKATKETIDNMNFVISDITEKLDAMANENLDIVVDKNYPGDLEPLEISLKQIIASFNNIVANIKQAASQVESGSSQVASGSQSLSQGTTEQASSLQELSATITEISSQVKNTAVSSAQANTLAATVGTEMQESSKLMGELIEAISKISESSQQIGNIIKVIDDIAFQTNMLALNAAVEAARAGASGKGFAVVAEEVRNLAAKSAKAARDTTALIEGSIESVDSGTKIAGTTSKALNDVVSGAEQIIGIIGNISKAANEQAGSIAQVTQGIEQVSGVVQTNSATAEESAAASEELSSQASMLNDVVSRFKLRD